MQYDIREEVGKLSLIPWWGTTDNMPCVGFLDNAGTSTFALSLPMQNHSGNYRRATHYLRYTVKSLTLEASSYIETKYVITKIERDPLSFAATKWNAYIAYV